MKLRFFLPVAGAVLVAVAAFYFLTRQPIAAPQNAANDVEARLPVALSDAERTFIRGEMRGFLGYVQEILDASAAGDAARVAATARRAGMNGPEQDHIPKTLAVKLPLDFKKLGLATHRAFDKIAAEAEQRGNADSVPKQLGELMKNCVACHGTWRIVAEDSR
jgi:hypothetical protein